MSTDDELPESWRRTVVDDVMFDYLLWTLEQPPEPVPALVEAVREARRNPIFERRP